MADRVPEKRSQRLVLATLALGMGLAGCKEFSVKNGDGVSVVNPTNCWRYPGGEHASKLQAPLGQEDRGVINAGAKATIEAGKDDIFGPASGNFIRVVVNGEVIEPSKGIIASMAEAQGIEAVAPAVSKEPQACWVKSSDITPDNK